MSAMRPKPANQYEIGEYLVAEGLLTRKQLDTVFSVQKSTGGSLATLVVKLGFLDEATLTSFIAKALGVEEIDVKSLVIPEMLVQRLPREVLRRHQVLPIGIRAGSLQLATSDPTDYHAIEEVQFLTDMPVQICLASRSAITEVIEQVLVQAETKHRDLSRFLAGEAGTGGTQPFGDLLPQDLERALVPLLVEKGVIAVEELVQKARELRGPS